MSAQIDRSPSSSMRLLPALDFERETSSESTKPADEHDLASVSTELDSNNADISPSQRHVNGCSIDDVEETPRKWTWAFQKLTKLVADTKGAATQEVVKFVSKYLLGTKLILVVGKAGTGKTTILYELTGLADLKPGTTVRGGTKEYQVCPAIIDDEQYIFIDTVGFGESDSDDINSFRDTVSCLMALGSFVEIVGVLFVIGKTESRLSRQDATTMRWLQCFCGPAFFRNVTIVTSQWDSYNADSFEQAYGWMKDLYKEKMIRQILEPSDLERRYHGAEVYDHGVTGGKVTTDSFPGLSFWKDTAARSEELRNLIRRRYAERKYKPVKLQFRLEVEEKVPFLDTEAAKVLRTTDLGTVVRIVHGKCVIQAAKNSPVASSLKFKEVPQVEPETWGKSIYKWYELAVKVARYYQAARQKQGSTVTSAVQDAWLEIRAWWSGSSEEL